MIFAEFFSAGNKQKHKKRYNPRTKKGGRYMGFLSLAARTEYFTMGWNRALEVGAVFLEQKNKKRRKTYETYEHAMIAMMILRSHEASIYTLFDSFPLFFSSFSFPSSFCSVCW